MQEKPLTEVASEVQHVFQDSISVALNILGNNSQSVDSSSSRQRFICANAILGPNGEEWGV